MTYAEAIELIKSGVDPGKNAWADIGAGTGMFTQALMEILQEGTVYALDKSPHALWNLEASPGIDLHIVEGDFNRPMDLPEVDGIVMANALHYAEEPLVVLQNVTSYLKPGGRLILIEYDTETPRPPWVPFPVSWKQFIKLCQQANLTEPELIGSMPSQYGYDKIYSALTRKLEQ